MAILTVNQDYKDDERAKTIATIAALALFYFTPALISEFTGYKADYIALAQRANAAAGWITALFHVGVLLAGVLIWVLASVVTVIAGYSLWQVLSLIGRLLWAGLDWLLTMLWAFAGALWQVVHRIVITLLYGLSWPFRASAELMAHHFQHYTGRVLTARAERAELKALYREHYAQDFPSFRAFRQYCEAKQNYEDPPYPGQEEREAQEAEEQEAARREQEARERRARADREAKARQQREREKREREARARQQKRGQQKQACPQEQRDPYEAALSLLGLTEPFTKAGLEALYRTAMKKAHPDHGGNAKHAQHLNMARDLIKKRKDW